MCYQVTTDRQKDGGLGDFLGHPGPAKCGLSDELFLEIDTQLAVLVGCRCGLDEPRMDRVDPDPVVAEVAGEGWLLTDVRDDDDVRPCSANARAMARPLPLAAPVTTAVSPLSKSPMEEAPIINS